MNEYHILIIEDDHAVALGLEVTLKREGWHVISAHTGQDGLQKLQSEKPDLIILDIGLPDITGFQVCSQIREISKVPIIFLTARDEEIDKVLGLELGADDYMTKPISIRELCSRVRAALRRAYGSLALPLNSNQIDLKFAGIEIDLLKRTVKRETKLIELTSKEFDLLVTLAKAPGRVFTRELLLQQIWDFHDYDDDRVVNVNIHRLRDKLESDPSKPQYILTVRGVGYKFNDQINGGS